MAKANKAPASKNLLNYHFLNSHSVHTLFINESFFTLKYEYSIEYLIRNSLVSGIAIPNIYGIHLCLTELAPNEPILKIPPKNFTVGNLYNFICEQHIINGKQLLR